MLHDYKPVIITSSYYIYTSRHPVSEYMREDSVCRRRVRCSATLPLSIHTYLLFLFMVILVS